MNLLKAAALLFLGTPLFGVYQYYYTDTFSTFNWDAWSPLWYVYTGPTGFYTTISSLYHNDGIVRSKLAVPDGTRDYEVKATIHYAGPHSGEHYIYLRSLNLGIQNATYYRAVLTYWPNFRIKLYKNCCTLLASSTAIPHDGMVVRAIIRGSEILVNFDGELLYRVTDSTLTEGKPALGGYIVVSSNAIASASLGVVDRLAPNAVDPGSLNVAAYLNSVQFQWQAASDDPDGVGVGAYAIYRNGQLYDRTTATSCLDTAVSPGTTYTYSIYTEDLHGNQSTATTFDVTTPVAGPPPVEEGDGRRLGVRPTGSYWGAGGEQIDTLSGNLSYTIPLLTAMGRGGWSVPFALSYNSQIWRKDSGGV